MRAILKITSNGKNFEIGMNIGDEIIIGRKPEASCQIEDDKLSGKHISIKLSVKYLVIKDLTSKNGTFLNGICIEKSEIFVGDHIKVGGTLITLDVEKMDSTSINILTFPGPDKNKLTSEMKTDFTGARDRNQYEKSNSSLFHVPTHNLEVDIRKKGNGQIRLSRQGIRSRNLKLYGMALFIDMVILVLVLVIPMAIVGKLNLPELTTQTNRSIAKIMTGVTAVFLFLIWNFKMRRFSLGEKLMGIERKYESQ